MDEAKFLIIGANGQLGRALSQQYPNAQKVDVTELDISDTAAVTGFDWSNVTTILNAAAYTNVDGAETPEGRVLAWKINASAVSNLAGVARQHDITLVHISTDYVFDGSQTLHNETESYSPLSVYGASKAAGDLLVQSLPKHYLLRTSWVIGEGKNFVRTMLTLGKEGKNPTVVSDQIGRLTFTSTLTQAINSLLSLQKSFGTYNVTNDGDEGSWAEVTSEIFKAAGLSNTVTGITTQQYYAGKTGIAPRPLHSTLDLSKIKAAGFTPNDWRKDLVEYIKKESV